MLGEKCCLKALMTSINGKTVWTGTYGCSFCGVVFHPDPVDAAKLAREFEKHKESQHTSEPSIPRQHSRD